MFFAFFFFSTKESTTTNKQARIPNDLESNVINIAMSVILAMTSGNYYSIFYFCLSCPGAVPVLSQGDPRARSKSKNEAIAYFSKLFSLIDAQIVVFFRLYNIFGPPKIRQIWISHHTIHLKSCLSHTDYHTISYSYCFATWSKHHQSVCLKGMVVSIYA